MKKVKLELTWIGEENRPRLEPHILIEDPEKKHHANQRDSYKDIFDSLLILAMACYKCLQWGMSADAETSAKSREGLNRTFRIHNDYANSANECVFRSMWAGDSIRSGPPIPV